MKIHINVASDARPVYTLSELGEMPIGTVAVAALTESDPGEGCYVTIGHHSVLFVSKAKLHTHKTNDPVAGEARVYRLTKQEVEINVLEPGQTPDMAWTEACVRAMFGVKDPIQFMRDIKHFKDKVEELAKVKDLAQKFLDIAVPILRVGVRSDNAKIEAAANALTEAIKS